MSFGSPISPFDPDGQDWWSKGSSGLTQQISGVGRFLRDLRTQLRFGALSRAPLQLIRFEINQTSAECDWIARDPDRWDADLSRDIGRRHASLQALKDTIDNMTAHGDIPMVRKVMKAGAIELSLDERWTGALAW